MEAKTVWTPLYERWRHGGWYVFNNHYPNGGCGCISNNYADKQWRLACDERKEEYTYESRDAAARAEREWVLLLEVKDQLQIAVDRLCYLKPERFDSEEHEAEFQLMLDRIYAAIAKVERK
jgi:hypothetical protein